MSRITIVERARRAGVTVTLDEHGVVHARTDGLPEPNTMALVEAIERHPDLARPALTGACCARCGSVRLRRISTYWSGGREAICVRCTAAVVAEFEQQGWPAAPGGG